jgi:CheY-like chemotaxis protein
MSKALILIVEDNALNRKLERDVLQHNGYATLEAETAEEAMRLARKSCGAYSHGHLASRDQRNRGVGSVADRTRHARYPGDRGYRLARASSKVCTTRYRCIECFG